MPKILMAAGNHWLSPIQVGDHHLARRFLGDGWHVGFLSSPLSPLHLLGGEAEDVRQRYSLWANGGRHLEDGTLWCHVPGAVAVPHRRRPFNGRWLLRNWHRLTIPRLETRLRDTGFDRVDILHVRDVRFGFLLDLVKYDRAVFRLADNDYGFTQFSSAYHEELACVARRVTHLYYTAKSLEPVAHRLAPACATYIPNGVTTAHFIRPKTDRPADLQDIPDPIALYVGSIDRWFNFELLRYAANTLPSVSFVLIGPPRNAREHLGDVENIFILGRRNHDAIPAYLQHAAVGLIPFDRDRHATLVDAINPIKLYEYLAAGLPTVAVSWEELRRIDPPAALCTTPDEFVDGIRRYIEAPPDRATLQRFARRFDWGEVYTDLRRFLGV